MKTKKEDKRIINEDSVREAYETLKKYKAGKTSLEKRIIDDEQWWKMKNYDNCNEKISSSGWLFNAIVSKHADVMDNMPDVCCLPKEESDSETAKLLSEVIPVILEENKFENTYSDCWYDKLKSGTACYGVFWNNLLSDGLGNIDIRRVDLLNLFWEPGINDIQKSKNVFHLELFDNDLLSAKYPILSDSLSAPDFDTSKYIYDDSVDTSDKSCVIDWYYKKAVGKKEILHFCKFCNGVLLYASENDENYKERGFYDHGKYPFFFDKLYTVQGSPCGMGVIDMMSSIQTQIDTLDTSIIKNAKMAANRRFFVRADGSINENEFADWKSPFVHYQGSGDPNSSIMPIEMPLLSGVYVSILNNKIDELKQTSGNQDFTQGTVTGGVTAASAIEALQEAGTKTSRDMISGTYRVFEDICSTVIKLIKQFYSVSRCFRITGSDGKFQFKFFGAENLFTKFGGEPSFDIKIRAQKKSAFSRASQNELACHLYEMGLFAPENRESAEMCIEMMDFEGRDALLAKIKEKTAGGGALDTGLL